MKFRPPTRPDVAAVRRAARSETARLTDGEIAEYVSQRGGLPGIRLMLVDILKTQRDILQRLANLDR